MNFRNVLLAATVLVFPAAAAMAQPVSGPYVAGGVGYTWSQNIDIQSATFTGIGSVTPPPITAPAPALTTTRTFSGHGVTLNDDGGFIGLGSVGYGFGDVFGTGGGVRVELEGNYRGANYKPTYGGYSVSGLGANNYGVMVNALYDFDLGPVNPYFGAGLGYEWTSVNSKTYSGSLLGTSGSINVPGNSEGSFAVQAILGVSIPVGVPGLSVTAEYRFLAAVENETFNGSVTSDNYCVYPNSCSRHTSAASATIGDQLNHSFLVGLRYAFNAAPPPPPPAPAPIAAPAPAPARTYLVFFDWDRADLTGRARQIIAEAAQASTHVQLTQIEVSGFADRTGTAQYNLALSRRRADNVAAELVRLGVPKNVIAIQAFGDTHLLVPTAAGVREPQNRRVEIVLK